MISHAPQAFIFDMDGVLLTTRPLHVEAWQKTFDEFSHHWPAMAPFPPYDSTRDYEVYLDGRPRQDGIHHFLKARGKCSSEQDLAASLTWISLRKNEIFNQLVSLRGVAAFDDVLPFLKELRSRGFKLGLVTSSQNAPALLKSTCLDSWFDVVLDGNVALALGLHGKPCPDVFIEMARQLGTTPWRAVVLEDASAGIHAARAAGIGMIVAVIRDHANQQILAAGADHVIRELRQFDLQTLGILDMNIRQNLSRHPFFSDLAPGDIDTLCDCAMLKTFAEGEKMSITGQPAEHFYLILSGRVVVRMTVPGGSSQDIQTLQNGDIVGWSWLFAPYRWNYDVTATESTQTISFDATCLRHRCDMDPRLGYVLVKRFAQLMNTRLRAARLRLLGSNTNSKGHVG